MAKVVHWNCRSVVSKKPDLIYLINKLDPIIVCLQETWLKPGFPFKIPGFSIVREDRSDGYAGVGILIKSHLPFSIISIPLHSDSFSITAVKVNNICYASIYIPHPSLATLHEVSSILSHLPQPFLLMGDFNCSHMSWGSPSNNYYGSELLEIIDYHNLCVLNSGSPTTRSRASSNVLDLSICSANLASSLNWSTFSSTLGSDHYPIIINLPFKNINTNTQKPRMKYSIRNNDWDVFKQNVDMKINQVQSDYCSADSFTKILIEAADESFPVKRVSKGKIPSPPWWDNECSEAIKSRKEAEMNYLAYTSSENFDLLSKSITGTRKLFKKKKFDSWRKFCSEISPDIQPSAVWQKIHRFRSLYKESKSTVLPYTIANEFLSKLSPPSVQFHNIPLPISDYSELNSLFSFNELQGVLSVVRDSAPGPDGIPYSFLSNLTLKHLRYLLILSLIYSLIDLYL